MNKIILTFVLMVLSHTALAGYTGGHTVGRVSVSQEGVVKFGTTSQASNTCNYNDFHFNFDSNTEGGKSMLSLLLSAKMGGVKIDIWYTSSVKPSTDHAEVCADLLATATHIGQK